MGKSRFKAKNYANLGPPPVPCHLHSCEPLAYNPLPQFDFTWQKHCSFCGTMSNALLACQKCKTVAYCSRDCQKADWNNVHKKFCGLATQREEFRLNKHTPHAKKASSKPFQLLNTDVESGPKILKRVVPWQDAPKPE